METGPTGTEPSLKYIVCVCVWGASGLSECTGQKRLVHSIIYKANESFI